MKPAVTDQELIHEYLHRGAGDAFAELVRRHVHWVNSMAARLVHDRAMADDVTQAVFALLAQKADTLRRETVVSTWLFTVTRYAASAALRKELRRRKHESRAAAMREQQISSASDSADSGWDQLAPMLDELVGRLRTTDRQAVLLRFYEQRSFPEIGQMLSISEEAARKRVSRAVEQLRGMFARKGVAVGAGVLATTISANLTQPASAAVVAGATAAPGAVASAVGGSAALPLAKAAGTMLALASLKPVAAVVLGIAVMLGTTAAVMQLGSGQSSSSSSAPMPATQSATRPSGALGHVVKPVGSPGTELEFAL